MLTRTRRTAVLAFIAGFAAALSLGALRFVFLPRAATVVARHSSARAVFRGASIVSGPAPLNRSRSEGVGRGKGTLEAAAPPATAVAAAITGAVSPLPPVGPPARLLERPPRRAPPWLVAGQCTPPPGSPSLDASPQLISAFSSFAEPEHSAGPGPTVLGECLCPLRDAAPGFVFDCGANDWRILSDLAPWHGVNVTHAMLDAAFELTTANIPPTYHFSIHGGVVYAKTRQPVSVYHDRLFDMLRTLARAVPLPDVEWVMHGWDHAKVWRQDPIPVFSFVRDAAKTDVTVPYPYVWGQGGFDFSFDSNCPRDWGNRSSSKVTWRGGCTGPAAGYQDVFAPLYLRYRATALTRERGAATCLTRACRRRASALPLQARL